MNIDDHPAIAGQLGIQSIPAVIAFVKRPAGRRLRRRPSREPGEGVHRPRRRPGRTVRGRAAGRRGRSASRGRRRRRRRRALRRRARRAIPSLIPADRRSRPLPPRHRRARRGAPDARRWCRRPRRAIRGSPPSAPSIDLAAQTADARRRRRARGPRRRQSRTTIRPASTSPSSSMRAATARARPTASLKSFRKDRSWEEEKARKQLAQVLRGLGPDRRGDARPGAAGCRRCCSREAIREGRQLRVSGARRILPAIIPVFPLPAALLLPRAEMPLNIFEPRYLAMVDAALAGDRVIGMIQPDEGTAPCARGPASARSAAPAASPPSPRPATAAT